MARIENWALRIEEKADYIVSKCLITFGCYREAERVRYYEKLALWGTNGANLIGIVSDRRADLDGEFVKTSPITVYGDGFVQTESGSIYELGEKAVDYVRFEEAVENGMPIISDWAIAPIYKNDDANSFFMQGKMIVRENVKFFAKEVKNQNLENKTIEFADGTIGFLDYLAMNPKQKRELTSFFASSFIDMNEEFCGLKGLPIFDKVNWYAHCGTIPIEDWVLMNYRSDKSEDYNLDNDDGQRLLIVKGDDMASEMSIKERLAVVYKEVEA